MRGAMSVSSFLCKSLKQRNNNERLPTYIISTGDVSVILIVESLEVRCPHVLVSGHTLLESAYTVSTHDRYSFFAREAKLFLHETHCHGTVKVFISKLLLLFRFIR